MKPNVAVSTIMTQNVLKLNLNDNLTKAEMLYKKHKVRHLPVVQNENIVGMLSYTDLLRISFVDAIDDDENEVESTVYNMFSIEQVMTKNLEKITSDTTIKEAAKILSKKEFHALPVVDHDVLVGILTTTDLIKYLLEQYEK